MQHRRHDANRPFPPDLQPPVHTTARYSAKQPTFRLTPSRTTQPNHPAEAAERLLHGDGILAHALARGKERTILYKQNWQEVDINEVIAKFAPGAKPKKSGVKIHFVDPRGQYKILADVSGGYLRIQDIAHFPKKKRVFVDLNGNDVRYVIVNGKLERRDKESAMRLTHFRIKKRPGMKEWM